MTEAERRATHLARRGQKDKSPAWVKRVKLTDTTMLPLDFVKLVKIDTSGKCVVVTYPGECPCGCGIGVEKA